MYFSGRSSMGAYGGAARRIAIAWLKSRDLIRNLSTLTTCPECSKTRYPSLLFFLINFTMTFYRAILFGNKTVHPNIASFDPGDSSQMYGRGRWSWTERLSVREKVMTVIMCKCTRGWKLLDFYCGYVTIIKNQLALYVRS